jgi:hypothetical protein
MHSTFARYAAGRKRRPWEHGYVIRCAAPPQSVHAPTCGENALRPIGLTLYRLPTHPLEPAENTNKWRR